MRVSGSKEIWKLQVVLLIFKARKTTNCFASLVINKQRRINRQPSATVTIQNRRTDLRKPPRHRGSHPSIFHLQPSLQSQHCIFLDEKVQALVNSLALRLICVPARAFETGQFCLAPRAYSWNWASSMPGTSASVSRSIWVMVKASLTFSNLTCAVV